MLRAIIIRSSRRVFDCKDLQTHQVLQATALGNLLKDDFLTVGDEVELRHDSTTQQYIIEKCLPRKSFIFRKLVREKKIKPVAANVDLLVIVCSVSHPHYKQGLIDRYLVRSAQWNIPTAIVFNKMDQYQKEVHLPQEQERLKSLPVTCFEVSAHDLQYQAQYLDYGYQDFKKFLKNKRSLFLGQSGVGKSKLINQLTENQFSLLSKDLGRAHKGAHTTTWSELIQFEDWELIDSPGIRSHSLNDLKDEELIDYFPDLNIKTQLCQFHDCDHTPLAQGCYFHSSQVTPLERSRFESFLKIKDEIQKEQCN